METSAKRRNQTASLLWYSWPTFKWRCMQTFSGAGLPHIYTDYCHVKGSHMRFSHAVRGKLASVVLKVSGNCETLEICESHSAHRQIPWRSEQLCYWQSNSHVLLSLDFKHDCDSAAKYHSLKSYFWYWRNVLTGRNVVAVLRDILSSTIMFIRTVA